MSAKIYQCTNPACGGDRGDMSNLIGPDYNKPCPKCGRIMGNAAGLGQCGVCEMGVPPVDTRPTVPLKIDGLYLRRDGISIYISLEDEEYHDGDGKGLDPVDGKLMPRWDLIELIAIAVPVQELAQLRRAEAVCENANTKKAQDYFDAWLAHHTKELMGYYTDDGRGGSTND